MRSTDRSNCGSSKIAVSSIASLHSKTRYRFVLYLLNSETTASPPQRAVLLVVVSSGLRRSQSGTRREGRHPRNPAASTLASQALQWKLHPWEELGIADQRPRADYGR